MKRALLVRAGQQNELIDRFLRGAAVYVGWDRLDDLSRMSPAEIESAILRWYPECKTAGGEPAKHYREIVDFAVVVKPGDIIVTPHRAGKRMLVGSVSRPYCFDEQSTARSGGEAYRHSLPVLWTYAISRGDLPEWVFRDTDQRGKTTFWLQPPTVEAILSAPELRLR